MDHNNLFNSDLRKYYKEMHFRTNDLISWPLLSILSKQAVQMVMALWTFKEDAHRTFAINTAKFLIRYPSVRICVV